MNLFTKSLLTLALLVSSTASAQNQVVEVVPFAQYSWLNHSLGVVNRGSAGAEFGVFAGRHLELQVSATSKFFQNDAEYTPADAHLVWNFSSLLGSTTFRPLLGVGGTREKLGVSTLDGVSGLAGVRVGFLKAEAVTNFLPDLKNRTYDRKMNYSARVGVSVPFGRSRPDVVVRTDTVVVRPAAVVVTRTDTVTVVRRDTVKVVEPVKGASTVRIPYRKDKP